MKNLLILGMCLATALVAWAQAPNFDYYYFLRDSEGYIVEENYYSAPEIGDWDDDGDFDLLVGVFYYGNVYYYENISTGPDPEFADHVLLQADGSNLSVTYG